MELKYELIRQVLLIVESKKDLRNFLDLEDIYADIDSDKYSIDDIAYTLLKSRDAGLIEAEPIKGTQLSQFIIGHLTFYGHEFLNSVADENVWEETKSKASKLKSVTLPVLQQLAVSIMNRQLGLS
ncbi:hypothetical protein BUZ62_00835 [Staphylococcus pasteuri]|mgnify:CR=1 FL=1|uniref:DUF2513 domain-containing protein n=1 Tax=Staphylococcus pasteuri TaxID=45972 RepID=UPI000D393484|nr:DUF2513 domain-containing protein [Staphylococcus pasteuri]MEB7433309.1 DUF2513 domain-containing protein [Staphylococcus pasteuri]PTU88093.1 hypothetical protein BUZ62_00835 [Staphylococcus pasteuri]